MVVYMETKVTSDSFTATSELPAVVVPPCSLTEAMSSCTEDPKPLSVQAAFRGKNVLITGAEISHARTPLHLSAPSSSFKPVRCLIGQDWPPALH